MYIYICTLTYVNVHGNMILGINTIMDKPDDRVHDLVTTFSRNETRFYGGKAGLSSVEEWETWSNLAYVDRISKQEVARDKAISLMGRHSHLYSTARWKGPGGLREQHLKEHPLCWYCLQVGKVTPATVVDHIKPHRGNEILFFDPDNLRSLDKQCHDSLAAIKDKTGYAPGVGLDGMPIDPGHPFNENDRQY